jgi:hypothetical protein
MKMKSNRAFRLAEILSLTVCAGLLAGCGSEESLDMPAPAPQPQAASFETAAVLTATAPEMVAPPGAIAQPDASASVLVSNAATTGEVPLYNIAPEDLVKHPKWGPVLQQLSQSCVAFFAAEKRVPGSVEEMQSKGFIKEVPAVPQGMMFQIDGANYRVLLVSM